MRCKNCKHLIKGWCAHKLDRPDPDLDRECKDYTQATNGDILKAMSNDELSDQLVINIDGLQPCRVYLSVPTGKIYLSRAEAVKTTNEWLQQPAEGR